MRTLRSIAVWSVLGLCSVVFALAQGCVAPAAGPDIQARGEEIVRTMADVNRCWLITPSPEVRNYKYEFTLGDSAPKTFGVKHPARAHAAVRQGITYSTAIHKLVADPAGASFSEIQTAEGTLRLCFHFKEPLKIHCGNGVWGSWRGYFSRPVQGGTLLLDRRKMVPLESKTGDVRETFAQYVEIADGRYAPLSIRIDNDDMHFDWKFRVYEPGLWLFDTSRYWIGDAAGARTVASIGNVVVNLSDATAAELPEIDVASAASSKARSVERSRSEGRAKVETLVAANRPWLVPPLEPRHNLVYEYRQEAPYTERVLFDADGNIMAQLQSSKDSPDSPTRQRLYQLDGTKVVASFGEPYVKEERVAGPTNMTGKALLHQERLVNELAVGLALDCALTRLARDPSAFKAAVEPTQDGKGYRLLLDAPGRAKIFTGTMLAFTSWAYMHDVRYRRSEIVVDAATHRPLEEKDYDHSGKLVAAYTFSDYLEDPAGAAPGRIQALVPYEKDGADHSLEMDARFAFVRRGVWLMQRCHSAFRGGQGGSTGTVTVLPPTAENFAPVRQLRARLAATRKMIAQANAAPAGRAVIPFKIGQPIPAWMKAAWTETSGTPEGSTVIVVKEAEIERPSSGTYRLTLKLLSTAYWTEYKTRVTAELRGSSGVLLTETAVTVPVRAEGTPALVEAACGFPALAKAGGVSALPRQLVITATVERITASYHGHGVWMTWFDPSPDDDNTASADGKRAWGPEQATGEPDTFQAGDIRTAWASLSPDDQKEWLLLEYAEAVVPAAVKIYETYNPGAVHKVTVFASDGSEVPVWSGEDPTPSDKPMGVSEIPIKTNVKTNRLKIYIDSPSVPGWNEVDAVGLVDGTGKTHWAVTATASSTYAQEGR